MTRQEIQKRRLRIAVDRDAIRARRDRDRYLSDALDKVPALSADWGAGDRDAGRYFFAAASIEPTW